MLCPACNGTGHFEPAETREGRIGQIKILLQQTPRLSYDTIADMVQLHKSTVGYYAKKLEVSRVQKDLIVNPASIEALEERGQLD